MKQSEWAVFAGNFQTKLADGSVAHNLLAFVESRLVFLYQHSSFRVGNKCRTHAS